MLKPSKDRLDYGRLLTPPIGYKLVSAVGTTYSLDLDTLVGICIALGLSENIDNLLMKNPIYLLEALRQTSDKVVLFCEAGQIMMPASYSSLYILLEKMVFQVSLSNKTESGIYPSFHPKFWLLKYSNDMGHLKYRTIVLSRNLTFDRSWDISVALDGSVEGETAERSEPISDFLRYLAENIQGMDDNSKAKRKMLKALSKDIMKVSFSLQTDKFSDFDFIPIGVKDSNGNKYDIREYRLFSDTFHEILIMSPFLSDSVIKEFNERNRTIKAPDCTLITRKSSLGKLKASHCDKFRIYTMKDTIIEGETSLSDEDTFKQKQDIHAKVYLHRKYSTSELYLGSMNATHRAVNGNIEFMLRLEGPNRYINATALKQDLFGDDPNGKQNPFEESTITCTNDYEDMNEDSILQGRIKELCRARPHAAVFKSGEKYDLQIEFDKLIKNTEGLSISPMLSNRTAQVTASITIKGLNALQLSEFYRITAIGKTTEIERVIKIVTENIPENRENEIVSSIISDKKNFIEYIAFLLGDDYLISLLENQKLHRWGFFSNKNDSMFPALYERMLRTAARTPQKFEEIEYIMRMIEDNNIIPEGFSELYNTFKKAVEKE